MVHGPNPRRSGVLATEESRSRASPQRHVHLAPATCSGLHNGPSPGDVNRNPGVHFPAGYHTLLGYGENDAGFGS